MFISGFGASSQWPQSNTRQCLVDTLPVKLISIEILNSNVYESLVTSENSPNLKPLTVADQSLVFSFL